MTTRNTLAKTLLWEVSLAIALGSAPAGASIAAVEPDFARLEGVMAQAVATPTPPPPPKPKVQTTPEATPTPRGTTTPARGAGSNPTASPAPTPTASPSSAAVVSPTPTPAATTVPMTQPATAASEVMPTTSEEERIQTIVQAEVDRLFSKTTNLLNWVLGLTLFLVAGTWVGIWLMRRSVAEQVGTEVKKQLGGELDPQMTSANADRRRVSIVPHSPPPQPSDNTSLPVLSSQQKAEQNAQLNELISMALATQNLIAEARSALEESAKFQDSIQKPFQDVLGVYLTQAKELVAEGKYQEAVEIYDRSISINPEFYDAWLERGKALSKMQRHDEAIASYNKAIQLDSSRCDSWYEKACCYAIKGDVDLVIDNLRQAINLDPSKKEKAKFDATFAQVRGDEAFAQLILA